MQLAFEEQQKRLDVKALRSLVLSFADTECMEVQKHVLATRCKYNFLPESQPVISPQHPRGQRQQLP